MGIGARNRTVVVGLGAVIVLAIGAWVAGAQIRSPAQIAAETAAPDPSAITVPVEQRVLSSEVIVRGTVRYGSPQPVVLATSTLKQNSSATGGNDIVTTRPRQGGRLSEGSDVMSVSGRPVFVLRGAQPSHRDIGPGSRGHDVRQLEGALSRMGFSPGRVDGRYTGATGSAVARWYEASGWAPFGATDTQLDQLRAARAAAAAARDAYLQSSIVARGAAPGDIAQARIDLQTARDAVVTAQHDLASQGRGVSLALANERRDNALAAADVALKRAGLNKAIDASTEAKRNLAEIPPGSTSSEVAALQAAVRAAADDVTVAQADLNAALASERATRESGRDAVTRARADRTRAEKALPGARRQVLLAERRLEILRNPGDNQLEQLVVQAAGQEARSTEREVARLARKIGITVPADEVLFFPTLPLRVDSVRVRRGDAVSGRVMTVSNSRLAIDSSLSLADAKLVRPGAQVRIEEPDLGIKTTGLVTQVADAPGTHKVEQGRVYVSITPKTAPAQLVGASVKLTIAVKSTDEAVLTVPVTALSVGADGTSRVQVQRGGRTEYVTVEPGLAAQGLVEIRPVQGELPAGTLVIVGQRGDAGGGERPAPPQGAPPQAGRPTAPLAPAPRVPAAAPARRGRRARPARPGEPPAARSAPVRPAAAPLLSAAHLLSEPAPETGMLASQAPFAESWAPPADPSEPAHDRSPVVELRGIGRTYGTDPPVHALRGVDLTVFRGDWLAIVGPSGSGKSTLLHILGCLDRPTAGTYLIDGIDAAGLDDEARAAVRGRRIGFVFQTFHLLGHRTALENVMLADVYSGGEREGRVERAQAALERVGMGARRDFLPTKLSGGEQQRVAIARALFGTPSLLLCDEPTGNLDSANTESVLSLFHDLEQDGLTLVVITHEEDVAAHARRAVRIVDGRLTEMTR